MPVKASDASARKPSGETALITGASLGIGLELARLAAQGGSDLILVARSEDRLRQLGRELEAEHKIKVTVIGADLAEPGAAARLHAQVQRLGLSVTVLINNAGYGQYGAFLDISPAVDARMLQLNMVFLTEATRFFGKDMVARRHGRILNIASTAAFQPGPLMATYYASKAYVLFLSEALANELAGTGVTVTALCPGPTRSGFQDAAQMQGSRLLSMGMMEAKPVAAAGYRAMLRGKRVVIPGAMNWLLAESIRMTPRAWVLALSRFIADRKSP